jgi:hypothetical protein
MSKTIHKILLDRDERVQSFTLSKGALPLSIKVQYNIPVLYFLVDPDEKRKEGFSLRSVQTGSRIDDSDLLFLYYFDTAVLNNGTYVIHYFMYKK